MRLCHRLPPFFVVQQTLGWPPHTHACYNRSTRSLTHAPSPTLAANTHTSRDHLSDMKGPLMKDLQHLKEEIEQDAWRYKPVDELLGL